MLYVCKIIIMKNQNSCVASEESRPSLEPPANAGYIDDTADDRVNEPVDGAQATEKTQTSDQLPVSFLCLVLYLVEL